MKLVIATRNKHKLEEIRTLFTVPDLEIVSAFDFPDIPDVIEDGDTFEANSLKKALILARATGCWALADDSGLEVDALDKRPGIYSARYAGEPCDHAKNNAKLLEELANKTDRTARFRCVIALSSPTGQTQTVSGHVEGRIGHELRGTEGFGYDPLFIPDGHTTTFAELGPEIKNSISHRGRALKKALASWRPILQQAQGK